MVALSIGLKWSPVTLSQSGDSVPLFIWLHVPVVKGVHEAPTGHREQTGTLPISCHRACCTVLQQDYKMHTTGCKASLPSRGLSSSQFLFPLLLLPPGNGFCVSLKFNFFRRQPAGFASQSSGLILSQLSTVALRGCIHP